MKPHTPLTQAKHWGIFCRAIPRPRFSPHAVCLNDHAVHRVAFRNLAQLALRHCLVAACCQLVQRRPNLNEASAFTVVSGLFIACMICYSYR